MNPTLRTTAVLAAAGLLLAGCTNDTTTPAAGSSSPAPSASASAPAASASPTPTSTLPPAKQKAVDQAAAVILAYEQMFYDLLADPEPYLNDLNNVVAQPQLKTDLTNLQQLVGAGEAVITSSGPVKIASVDPVKVDLTGDPATVVLEVCVDSTAATGTDDGVAWTGPREKARYRVVKTTYLPDPGWAVAKVDPPDGFDQPQPC